MTTRRFERRGIERRMQKRREEEFVKSLTDARDTLDLAIQQAERGSARTQDTLADFQDQMGEVYRQARRMESDD